MQSPLKLTQSNSRVEDKGHDIAYVLIINNIVKWRAHCASSCPMKLTYKAFLHDDNEDR